MVMLSEPQYINKNSQNLQLWEYIYKGVIPFLVLGEDWVWGAKSLRACPGVLSMWLCKNISHMQG